MESESIDEKCKQTLASESEFQKIYGEVKDKMDPIIISSIESLIEKSYDIGALDNETEREKLIGETILKGVELMQNPSFTKEALENLANEALNECKLDDIILSCLENVDVKERSEEEIKQSVKTDSKRDKSCATDNMKKVQVEDDELCSNCSNNPKCSFTTSSTASSATPVKHKSETMNNPSLSSSRLERLEESSKMISHTKVKKVIKNVSSSNPFVQRVSTATSTGLPKYMFSHKARQMKGGLMSLDQVKVEKVKIDVVPNQIKKVENIKKVMNSQANKQVDASTNTDNINEKPKNNNEAPVKASADVASNKDAVLLTNHSQIWCINNFSRKMKMANGKSIDSMFFSIYVLEKKTDWSLMLYPNGDKEKVAGNLSLYLTCRNRRGLNLSLEFKFTLINSDGESAAAPSKSGSISSKMLSTNSSWGWESFVKHEDLVKNNLLVNNKLTINCDISLKMADPITGLKNEDEETPLEDDRDIDALVDFVGEISVDGGVKKKKSKKSQRKVISKPVESEESEAEASSTDEELKVKVETNTAMKLVESVAPEDLAEFEVVTRRRRKNSTSNLSSSPTMEKNVKVKPKQNQKTSVVAKKSLPKEKNKTEESSKSNEGKTSEATKEVLQPSVKKLSVNEKLSSAFCLDTNESLEELLKTKNLLEENITKVQELLTSKSAAINLMKEDKDQKIEKISLSQEKLKVQKQSLEDQIKEHRLAIARLEDNAEALNVQLKRGEEKAARMKNYLDMNIADADNQLNILCSEKDDLQSRLINVEDKLRGNRQKERLLNIHNQILRLQTNLECPICAETAASPIYQCREVSHPCNCFEIRLKKYISQGHMVCASCEQKISRCPMCRQDGPVNIRNRYAENDSQELHKLLKERDEIMSKLTTGAIYNTSR